MSEQPDEGCIPANRRKDDSGATVLDALPFRTRPARRRSAGARNFDPHASKIHERSEQLSGIKVKWPSEPFHSLDLDLWLSPVLQFLVELELETGHLGHLLLREVNAQAEVPKILGEMMNRSHRPCYQSSPLAYDRTMMLSCCVFMGAQNMRSLRRCAVNLL